MDDNEGGDCKKWELGNAMGLQYIHKVKLTGLDPNSTYHYYVESTGAVSNVFTFTTMPAGNDWSPRLIVYGDMGRHGGEPTLNSLISQVRSGYPNAIIHAGDFAYDLDSDGGVNGDAYMNRIQPIAGNMPYMTCIGNHEDNYAFSNYINRFFMPGDSQNMWYSWNMGPIHFVAYSTEVYFTDSLIYTKERQIEWLQDDLTKANKNRDEQPWIIAYGHRPMYCSNADGDDCTKNTSLVRAGLEDLFFEQGIDLIIEAHEHSYERLWPVFNETVTQFNYSNPLAPVHIISGAAGCNEQDGYCINPIYRSLGEWSAFRSSGVTTYGYGKLVVYNSTHLHWQELQTLEEDKILDEIWIVQDRHGPFAPLE
eukprot:TRINITY_DN2034_c0_g1_i4.p1 TRINITY_DN2034_c0_g1~~TRINITY_DN2034_c0_g1_i4.p1  ORF type:complete len:366 (-),score=59.14 TRINITY_DN2034_c0_g1_i4:38-1135(-)